MDAGFPQTGAGKRIANPERIVARREDFAYVPTLEELIEACGSRFRTLNKAESADGWYAFNVETHSWFGSTPTEAVALLWLALNSQSS